MPDVSTSAETLPEKFAATAKTGLARSGKVIRQGNMKLE
jgi:hypothetical protein